MAKGKVKWFSSQKGYGFIKDYETHHDIFVHFSSIKMDGYKSLEDGAEVEYDIEIDENSKKERAKNVVVINKIEEQQ